MGIDAFKADIINVWLSVAIRLERSYACCYMHNHATPL